MFCFPLGRLFISGPSIYFWEGKGEKLQSPRARRAPQEASPSQGPHPPAAPRVPGAGRRGWGRGHPLRQPIPAARPRGPRLAGGAGGGAALDSGGRRAAEPGRGELSAALGARGPRRIRSSARRGSLPQRRRRRRCPGDAAAALGGRRRPGLFLKVPSPARPLSPGLRGARGAVLRGSRLLERVAGW